MPSSTRSNNDTKADTSVARLDWLDWARVLALLGIVWNHIVEPIAGGPLFTHPSAGWPPLAERLGAVWPQAFSSEFLNLLVFVGWLGDNCVGVFILLSGFGLAYSGYRSARHFFGRRLLRIYPAFIIAHFLVLLLAIAFRKFDIGFDNYRTVLSLLGLRGEESLFFYINPSWWFVWLILQLYLVFPLLWKVIERFGYTATFIGTLLITIASRTYAALYVDNVFYTYMGMFAGTRIVEFGAGAILGHAIANGRFDVNRLFTARKTGAYAFFYIFGFAVSLTWAGSTISNILISIGLAGMFASIGRRFAASQTASGVISWLSARSYSYYLVHQPPLIWMQAFTMGLHIQFILSVVWYLLCIPIAWLMDMTVVKLQKLTASWRALSSAEVTNRA